MTAAGGNLYFTTVGTGGYDLWKCDGTTASVVWQSPSDEFAIPLQMVGVGADAYFTDADSGENDPPRLWKYSSTTGDATLLLTMEQGDTTAVPLGLTAIGSTVYFQGVENLTNLWQSGGTAATTQVVDTGVSLSLGFGTGRLYNFDDTGFNYAEYSPLAAAGSSLYFATDAPFFGRFGAASGELYRIVDPFTQDGLQAVLDGATPPQAGGNPTVTLPATTPTQADAVVALFTPDVNGNTPITTPTGATTANPVDVVVTLPTGYTVDEGKLSVPAGVRLQINGGTWIGGSPALTLSSGDLTITGATFVDSTNAPTILVTGGHLTLRNDMIQETTGFAQVAVLVTGGTADLGTTADPGGNTINVNGTGTLIINNTATPVNSFGNTWEMQGTAVAGPVVVKTTPTITTTGGSFIYDEQPHPATGSVTGVNGENLGTPTFTYSYTDDNGHVVALAGPPVDPGYYTVTASFAGNDNYGPADPATATIMIAYEVDTLTDLSKAFHAGRTIPIKLQLTDANGNNISSPNIDVTATRLDLVTGTETTQVALQDAGNANPNDQFRYDSSLQGYIFNLSTKDLGAGEYDFSWMAGDDPTPHVLNFQLV